MSEASSSHSLARTLGVALVIAALLVPLAFAAGGDGGRPGTPAADAAEKARTPLKRRVLAVSNNWDGTVDIIDPRTLKRLKRINVAPDREARIQEKLANPVDAVFFLAIRQQIGEGNDQFADDAFTSPDGRFLYVSRPSFADVVSINMRTGKIVWRVEVEGQRSDHMGLSRNGRKLLVSDSTANKVFAINTAKGEIIGSFPSGDSPHENNFSKNGRRIYHASIGRVYTPTDMDEFDTSKGVQVFEIVNARTLKVIKQLDMGEELERAGYPGMSSAVRPMTLSPDERFVYFQVSFFHGFIEYYLKRFRVRRVINLPVTNSRGVPHE